ncbi:MAG: 4a-hydroxytetrahydrobiopterin dehydratase [Flavobacteriales bacterium]
MWMEKDNHLVREFRFKDFGEAFTFMTRVAFLAEQQGHHPVFHNEYSYVRIELNTHDMGHVVTERDRKLADAIDRLLQ